MAIEIEHKYLLINDDWRKQVYKSVYYKQGYLSSQSSSSIRVRIADKQAWLNIKSATIGNQRFEFEYEIPLVDAEVIMQTLCTTPLIEKTRHFISFDSHIWEIDEFQGENEGLIVAEVELKTSGENFAKPAWIGQEVTNELQYYNNNLAKIPYKKWPKK